MFFLLFVIVMRARKTGSTTMLSYLSTGFMYTKAANLILWFNADPRFGLLFLVLIICKYLSHFMLYSSEHMKLITFIDSSVFYVVP